MFETLNAMPEDPIFALSTAYRADSNPLKIDLGIGIYKDPKGDTPVMRAVTAAQSRYLSEESSKAYMAATGSPAANAALQKLIFGEDCDHSRIRTIQTAGGTAACRVAAELINRAHAGATVWVSNPTWGNHIPLMEDAGLKTRPYPYYDESTHSIDFDAMIEQLREAQAGDLVLLHGCCHNPCGADLSEAQWQTVADLAKEIGFTPFIDIAYQGFGRGLDEDAFGVRLMTAALPEVIVASSCSKNFGLYRERTGTLNVVSKDSAAADAALSQALHIVRAIYSMPPSNGTLIVETILGDEALTKEWKNELEEMRTRIKSLRELLASKLNGKDSVDRDFSFIEKEKGMFSYLGLSKAQVLTLREKYSIYMLDSSRVNIAGINQDNIDYLADSIEAVL